MYEERNYMIFNTSELDKIDWNSVLETRADTVRKSVDGTLTFVKWDGSMPECVNNLATKIGPYDHSEMLVILSGSAWTSSNSVL